MTDWELDVELPEVPPTHIEENYTSFYALDVDGVPGNDLAMRLHPNGLCVVALAPTHAARAADSGDGAGTGSAGFDAAAAGAQGTADRNVQIDTQVGHTSGGAAEAAGAGEAAAECGHAQQVGASQPPAGPQQQQQQAPAAGDGNGSGMGSRLALNQKLLQAEFRRGRGPLLQPDSVLGRLTVSSSTYPLRCCARGLLVDLNARLEGMRGAELLRALRDGYVAILEQRAAEAQQLAGSCLSEQQYRQHRAQQQRQQQQPPQQLQQEQENSTG